MRHKAKNIGNGFKAAFSGFKETLVYEKSFKAMLIISLIVITAMFYFPTSRLEKVVLLALVLAVLILELINATVERIMNFISPEWQKEIRVIKDLMAAIVLLASIGAAIIGIIIFWPYIMS